VDLVDAATGAQLWGKEYESKVSGVLAVKQSIAQEVTEKLSLRFAREQRQQLTKSDATYAEAYQFYLRGRYFFNKRTTDGMRKAIREFQQAIDKDPTYALAYVGLADCHVSLEQLIGTPSSETLPKARAAVERALQIDDSLGEAHASLGNVEMYSWNFDEAEREFKRAIELKPNYAMAHVLYCYYLRLVKGKLDEAMAEARRAQQLDPLMPWVGFNIAIIHDAKGERDAAIEEAKKVIEIDPNYPAAHLALGIIYCKQARYAEAIQEHEKGVNLNGRWSLNLGYLGECYATAGNRSKAEAILKELEEKYNRREALGADIAGIYAVLGKKDQAFAWLEKEFQAHSGVLAFLAHNTGSGMSDALRSDPRWNDLLRRIGLL
jgi:tetratricopeptide (TPR) repeat protein